MQSAAARILESVAILRVKTRERIAFSWFLAVLISILLWQTRWPSLRLGLFILLLAQALITLDLHLQQSRISRYLRNWEAPPDEKTAYTWFEVQEQIIGRLGLLENLGRVAGFAILGYGLWAASGFIWLAIGFGVIYPAVIYYGITRGDERRKREELRRCKREVESLFRTPSPLQNP